ncbi:MAG: glutamine synthetase type III, partial [Tidjanibacter sp.]|nr:glutamine synthetase type III [Tidjanibacter sp.]
LFSASGVFNKVELQARYEIKNEIFLKKIQIESRVIVDMALNHIVPTAIKYQNLLIENIKGIKEIFPDKYEQLAATEIFTLEKIATLSNAITAGANEMTKIRKRLNKIEHIPTRAAHYEQEIRPKMTELREVIDELEMLVDDACWPLPKYRELLATL